MYCTCTRTTCQTLLVYAVAWCRVLVILHQQGTTHQTKQPLLSQLHPQLHPLAIKTQASIVQCLGKYFGSHLNMYGGSAENSAAGSHAVLIGGWSKSAIHETSNLKHASDERVMYLRRTSHG